MKTYVLGPGTHRLFAVWTAPGAPETTPKEGGRSAPPFGKVSGAPGAVQTCKFDNVWVPEEEVFMIILIRSWGYSGGSGRSLVLLS